MNTVTITLASDSIAYLTLLKIEDPATTANLTRIDNEWCRTRKEGVIDYMKPFSEQENILASEAILRISSDSFKSGMKTVVTGLIKHINVLDNPATSVLHEYESKAIAKVTEFAEFVKGNEDRWLTLIFTAEGELVEAWADNDKNLMPGAYNSSLVVRPELEEEEDDMDPLHEFLVNDFGWEFIRTTAKSAGELVENLEQVIEFQVNANRKAYREAFSLPSKNRPVVSEVVEPYKPEMLAITPSAYRALIAGAGLDLWIDNYDYTFTIIDLPTCAIYVTSREAWWDKSKQATIEEAASELSKTYNVFNIVDDGSSEHVPVFLPGNQYKVIEITDWVETPPETQDYIMDPSDYTDEPPF